jgi:hypothetical protein
MGMQEEIKRVAYELYEKSGRVGGHELENWLAAEKIVMARYAQKEGARQPSTTRPTKKASAASRVKKDETSKTASKDIAGKKPRSKKTVAKKDMKKGK